MSTLSTIPRPTSARASDLQSSLAKVNARIADAAQSSIHPTLVAVSKYKPASDIAGAYDAGQRDFGENYVNELLEKAPLLPSDIRWHFIGHLQSNKAKAIAAVPNLHTIHTLTSTKLATALNKARPSTSPLNVFLQVNTSGEHSKSGLPPLDAASDDEGIVAVARHVITSCPNLRLAGLMTIGSLENSTTAGQENEDFQSLIRTRAILESVLKSDFPDEQTKWAAGLTLSMGMSSDFEAAIWAGSGVVRVGSAIFGERPKKDEVGSST